MSAELGGFTGMVEPDQETVRFLNERRGIDVALEPWMPSDPGAPYARVIRRRLRPVRASVRSSAPAGEA